MTEPKSSFAWLYNDVTAQNLDFYYLKLLDKIKPASFVALDFEFTGLCKAKTTDMNHRYVALKEAIESHTIVSMGISVIQRKTKKSDLVRSTKTDLPLSQPQPQSQPAAMAELAYQPHMSTKRRRDDDSDSEDERWLKVRFLLALPAGMELRPT